MPKLRILDFVRQHWLASFSLQFEQRTGSFARNCAIRYNGNQSHDDRLKPFLDDVPVPGHDLLSTSSIVGVICSTGTRLKCASGRARVSSKMIASLHLLRISRDAHGLGEWRVGSLGDRVSKATVVIQINDDTEIIDPEAFRIRLEKIAAGGELDQVDLKTVQTLLDAWDRKRAGKGGLFDK